MLNILISFIILFFSLGAAGTAWANDFCFCSHNISKITSDNWKTVSKDVSNSGCVDITAANTSCATSAIDSGGKPKYDSCEKFPDATKCAAKLTDWLSEYQKKLVSVGSYESGVGGVVGKILPSCVTKDYLSDECKDVGIFVVTAINVGKYLFSFVGALALMMLIYGGLTLILSQGNAEKTKKGYEIVVAAVIGLVIVFSAYVLVSYFANNIVKVKSSYKLESST